MASLYTTELVDEICEKISAGTPLSVICREPGMPGITTIWDWEKARPDVAERVARARDVGHERIEAEILPIADDLSDKAESRRVRTDVRLKLLACWNPRKWGARVQQDHGLQPDSPLASLLAGIGQSAFPIKKPDQGGD